MGSWRALRGLSPPERGALLEALLLLPVTALSLRVFGFRRCQGWLSRIHATGRARHDDPAVEAQKLARLVDVAARRGPWPANCLERSLVLWRMMRRRGLEVELRIGVRREKAGLEAHAWVEQAGVVLNDRPDVDRHFAAFALPDEQ
jgi:hypothetical protein